MPKEFSILNVYVSKLEFQIIDEYDKRDLIKEDNDINRIKLSITKDKNKEAVIKVTHKYFIKSKKFIVSATVNAIVKTDKQFNEFIKENNHNKNLKKDLAKVALSTFNSMNDKISVYCALLSSECNLPSFFLPHFKHVNLDDIQEDNE